MITKKAEYAVIALVDLAVQQNGIKTTTKEIVERRKIPPNLIAQILPRLRDAGWLQSTRGAGGGVFLVKDPAQITLREVIELIDGPLKITRCLFADVPCGDKLSCPLRDVWENAQDNMLHVFEKTTIKDLAKKFH